MRAPDGRILIEGYDAGTVELTRSNCPRWKHFPSTLTNCCPMWT
jgi:hypothetical protein